MKKRAVSPRREGARPEEVAGRRGHRRAPFASDATIEPEPGPGPEAVFDRVTGPYAYGVRRGLGGET